MASINFKTLCRLTWLVFTRGLAVLIQMLVQLFLARFAGPAGVGIMQLMQSWSCVLGEVMSLGMPTAIMKQLSLEADHSKQKLMLFGSILLVLRAAVVLVPTTAFILWLAVPAENEYQVLFPAVSISIILFAVQRIALEALKTRDRLEQSMWIENTCTPFLILLAGCTFAWIAGAGNPFMNAIEQDTSHASSWLITPELVIYIAVLCASITFGYCLTVLFREFSFNLGQLRSIRRHQKTIWRTGTRVYWSNSLLNILLLNLPFLLLPIWATTEEVGVFALAFKLINPISTILILFAGILWSAICSC